MLSDLNFCGCNFLGKSDCGILIFSSPFLKNLHDCIFVICIGKHSLRIKMRSFIPDFS